MKHLTLTLLIVLIYLFIIEIKDKKTQISIYPSDIHFNEFRKDFGYVLWFNR